MLALVKIPEHGDTVFAARGRKRAIGGDRDGIDVARVPVVIGLQLEF